MERSGRGQDRVRQVRDLTQTQNRLDQASRELDKLVGTRTRAIRRRLKSVTELSEAETERVLGAAEDDEPTS